MPSYGVSIKLDTATPFIRKIVSAISARSFLVPIGFKMAEMVKDNFIIKENDAAARTGSVGPSGYKKLGHVGLYEEMRNATHSRVSGTSAIVSISQDAVRQRLQGGKITPSKKYLTIPATEEAYGKRAREFSNLKFGYGFDPVMGILRTALMKKGSKNEKPMAFYWLVKSVNQKPDPTILPTSAAFSKGIKESMKAWIEDLSNG